MTNLRGTQFGVVSVGANPTAAGLRATQFGVVSVGSNPAAAGLRATQFGVIAVCANGKKVQGLGNPIDLGCWTPCGALIWNHNADGRIR